MKETNIKQIKQINNGSYKLPQYSIGTQILNNMKNLSGEQVISAASGTLDGVTQIISGSGQMSNAVQPGDTDSFTTTKQNASPYGHYYDTLSLNSNKFLDAAKTKANAGFAQTEMGAIGTGASIGSLFGPIGTGVGAVVGGLAGLFGLGSRNKAIEEAKQYAHDTYVQQTGYNKQNKSVATSMGMRDEYNAEHPNNISYAAEGKQAFDPKWNGTNGIAHEGEFQWDPYTNNGMKITHATNGRIKNNNTTKKYAYGTPGVTNTNYKEDVPVYTQPQHVIFSDIFPEMKYSNGTKNIAEVAEAAQTNIKNGNMPEQNRQILEDLVNEQGMYQKENIHKKYMNQYKCGKMPKYWDGTPYVTTGLSAIGGQISNMVRRNEINKRNTSEANPYVANPYLQQGLEKFKPTLDYSWVSPLKNSLQDAKYTYAHSGGITNGMRLIGLNDLYKSYANTYGNQRNAMIKQYYDQNARYGEAMLNAGNTEASRNTQGGTWAKDSANRKVSKNNDDLTTLSNANSQNWYDFNRNLTQLWQFNKNVDLYNKKLDIDALNLGK